MKEETLKLIFGETFIKIPCLEAKNNFLEINVNSKTNNIKYILIYKLLEVANTERKLGSYEVRNILENRDRKLRKEAKNSSPISRIFNEVKSVIKEINKLIKEEMKKNNLLEEDFILLNSQKANYSIFISDKLKNQRNNHWLDDKKSISNHRNNINKKNIMNISNHKNTS